MTPMTHGHKTINLLLVRFSYVCIISVFFIVTVVMRLCRNATTSSALIIKTFQDNVANVCPVC